MNFRNIIIITSTGYLMTLATFFRNRQQDFNSARTAAIIADLTEFLSGSRVRRCDKSNATTSSRWNSALSSGESPWGIPSSDRLTTNLNRASKNVPMQKESIMVLRRDASVHQRLGKHSRAERWMDGWMTPMDHDRYARTLSVPI